MKTLHLPKHVVARVWFDEPVGVVYRTSRTHRRATAGRGQPTSAGRAAIEVMVPRGGRAEYGLLGLSFRPAGDAPLTIIVPESGTDAPVWAGALASKIDTVRLGLAEEYVDAIMAVLVAKAPPALPGGELKVAEAAHGEVGSSSGMYSRLVSCLLELMSGGADQRLRRDDSLLSSLVERHVL